MSLNKNLFLFTSSFPYGEGEQFIETEIKVLSLSFKEIFIFPLKVSGNKRELPSNVKVIEPKLYSAYSRPSILFNNLGLILKIYLLLIFKSKSRSQYFKEFSRWFNFLLNRINDANWLQKEIEKTTTTQTVYYSYWFNLWGTILSIIKEKKGSEFKFFTRIHGGDFDEAQKKEGFFPFREFELTHVQNIYGVSNFGINYMKQRYANLSFNMSLSRLGVNDHGNNPFDPTKGYFQIVSCSFIYGLKRVNLIVDILANLHNIKVKWTHFGSGELEDEIKKYASTQLGKNIEIEFKGLVPNFEVIDFYKTTPVDLFLNTSELEGIPVSMMEAISFGIPIVGCDICGVPEIANEETGILIPKNFDQKTVANNIQVFLTQDQNKMLNIRKTVKQYWDKTFNGVSNYNIFTNLISS